MPPLPSHTQCECMRASECAGSIPGCVCETAHSNALVEHLVQVRHSLLIALVINELFERFAQPLCVPDHFLLFVSGSSRASVVLLLGHACEGISV